MRLRTVLRRLFDAVVHPAKLLVREPSFLRVWLRRRRIFDLVSFAMQAMRLRSVDRIETKMPDDSPDVAASRAHNAQVTRSKSITTTRRAEPIYRIAGTIGADLSSERLLIVGPRNVQELLIAWLFGFSWPNISAIDLYSTHPKIRVMDMHAMDLPDSSVDVVTMVNTLGYSNDIPRVIVNVARVLKPGGRFCFSHAHWPESTFFPGDLVSGADVIAACAAAGMHLYHHETIAKTNVHGGSQLSHYFGMRKGSPA
jgi:SAM-dependent methyltransferase